MFVQFTHWENTILELTLAEKQTLYENGFVKLPGLVSQELVHNALRAINSSLGSAGMDPAQLDIFRSQSYCPEVRPTTHITDLLYASRSRNLSDSTLRVE